MDNDEDDSSLLVILLDTRPDQWAALQDGHDGLTLDSLLQQLLVFLNSFQLLSDGNKLAIYGIHDRSCPLLYASPALIDLPGVTPTHTAAEGLLAALRMLASQDTTSASAATVGGGGGNGTEPCLSAALSRALCLIHRLQGGSEAVTSSNSRERAKPRILTITGSADAPCQYAPVMNAVFAAQRCGTVLDAAQVGGADSAFLQQAAYLTGGLYHRMDQPQGLVQYLVQLYCTDTHTRGFLAQPDCAEVDFRVPCFCHKRFMSMGYVCSVCLSIFCERLPECLTCGTTFAASNAQAADK